MSLIERTFREKIVLVGVTLPPAHRRGHRGRPRRALAAGRHRRRRRGGAPRAAPRRARSAHLHRQGQGRGAARARARDRLRHRRVRQRAHPGPAAQPREAARAHGHRPHRGDPRHLRPERPQPGGQGPGGAGPAPLPAAPHPRQGHRARRSRAAARRPAAPGSAPAARARRSSRSTAAASSAASTSSRPSCGRSTSTAPPSARRSTAPAPQRVAIVGYTNAGKSTLLNRLTDAGVLVEDRLFATLDATTRRLDLPGGEKVLLTDTVGFIRKLPHQLVEAFKSTLSVAADADLLVHVVDASALDPEGNIDAVRTVLREIDADEVPVLYAFNKADLAPERRDAAWPRSTRARWPSAPPPARASRSCCSPSPPGCGPLTNVVELAIPYDRGDVLAAVHREGEVLSEQADDDGMRLRVRLDDASLGQFVEYVVGLTCAEPFVPPPYPYDRLDELKAVGRAPCRAGSSTSRSARRATRRPPVVLEALARSGAERGYPPSIGTRRLPRGGGGLDGPPPRRHRRPRPRGGVRRHQGAGGRRAAVAAAAPARPRHRAVPGHQLPHLRDGRHARRLPGGALRRPRRPSTPPTPPGRCACG